MYAHTQIGLAMMQINNPGLVNTNMNHNGKFKFMEEEGVNGETGLARHLTFKKKYDCAHVAIA